MYAFCLGLSYTSALTIAGRLGFANDSANYCASILIKLYKLFIEKDCTLLEINPFAELANGEGRSISASLCQLIGCIFC